PTAHHAGQLGIDGGSTAASNLDARDVALGVGADQHHGAQPLVSKRPRNLGTIRRRVGVGEQLPAADLGADHLGAFAFDDFDVRADLAADHSADLAALFAAVDAFVFTFVLFLFRLGLRLGRLRDVFGLDQDVFFGLGRCLLLLGLLLFLLGGR